MAVNDRPADSSFPMDQKNAIRTRTYLHQTFQPKSPLNNGKRDSFRELGFFVKCPRIIGLFLKSDFIETILQKRGLNRD